MYTYLTMMCAILICSCVVRPSVLEQYLKAG